MAIINPNGQEPTPIPHEPGETMTFRPLSWDEVHRAERAKTAEKRSGLKDMGAIDFSGVEKALAELTAEQLAAISSGQDGASQDPAQVYDKGIVLDKGIVAWSYAAPVVAVSASGESASNTRLLDPVTADWAFNEIMALTFPRSADEGEA